MLDQSLEEATVFPAPHLKDDRKFRFVSIQRSLEEANTVQVAVNKGQILVFNFDKQPLFMFSYACRVIFYALIIDVEFYPP